jgi:hypothetical protein
MRLGGAQSRSGRCGAEKIFLPLPRIESLLLFDTSTNFIHINKRENDTEILRKHDPKIDMFLVLILSVLHFMH